MKNLEIFYFSEIEHENRENIRFYLFIISFYLFIFLFIFFFVFLLQKKDSFEFIFFCAKKILFPIQFFFVQKNIFGFTFFCPRKTFLIPFFWNFFSQPPPPLLYFLSLKGDLSSLSKEIPSDLKFDLTLPWKRENVH